jgi:inhibitor of cysteine peptidase
MRTLATFTWRKMTVLVLLLVMLLTAACGGKERIVSWDDNGRRLETAVGQTIVLTLDSDPSTGYTWMIEAIDEEALKPVVIGAFKANEDGKGGVQEFRFEAKIGRDVNLRIGYRPVDDAAAAAEKTFAVEVAIR